MRKNGYSLVEFMVVLALAAVLTAVAFPVYTGLAAKTRAKEGEQALTLLKSAQDAYHHTHGFYTDSFHVLKIRGFENGPSSAIFGQYTVTIRLTAEGGFEARATGYPLDDNKKDVWLITNAMENPKHEIFGY